MTATTTMPDLLGARELLEAAVWQPSGLSNSVLDRIVASYLGTDGDVLIAAGQEGGAMRRGRGRVDLPDRLLAEVEVLARGRDTTPGELIRRFVDLGLYVARVQQSREAELIVREGDRERELVWF
jgi:hypothetical protein